MDEVRIKLRDDITFGECDELSEQGIIVMENKVYNEEGKRSFEYLAICKTEVHKRIVKSINNRWVLA